MSHDPADVIVVEQLELAARVGVPEEERQQPQRLTVSIVMSPRNRFCDLEDDLSRAVDYSAVAEHVKQFVGRRSDKLIETLADALAADLLSRFAIRRVRVELRKFVLPDAKYVAAICEREA